MPLFTSANDYDQLPSVRRPATFTLHPGSPDACLRAISDRGLALRPDFRTLPADQGRTREGPSPLLEEVGPQVSDVGICAVSAKSKLESKPRANQLRRFAKMNVGRYYMEKAQLQHRRHQPLQDRG